MRTAILLTGFLRQKEATRAVILEKLVAAFDARLFVASWDIADIAKGDSVTNDGERLDPTPQTAAGIAAFYGDCVADVSLRCWSLFAREDHALRQLDRPGDVFRINPRAASHGIGWSARLFAQWLIVRDGLRMIEEHEARTGERFDLICRARTDFVPEDGVPDWPRDRVLTSAWPFFMGPALNWTPDFFLFGPATEMQKFQRLCLSLRDLYERQNVDVANAEAVLSAFIQREDIPVHPMEFWLRRYPPEG